MGSEADRKASPTGFPLRCPGGQTGPKPSIEEMPRPPSERGTSSLPGLATDNIGYQTASSGSDEAATGWLERYSGGHTPQDHTVATVSYPYSHNSSVNSRQPPALPPGAPTAAAQGLTQLLLFGILSRTPWEPVADPLWSADPSLKTAVLYNRQDRFCRKLAMMNSPLFIPFIDSNNIGFLLAVYNLYFFCIFCIFLYRVAILAK